MNRGRFALLACALLLGAPAVHAAEQPCASPCSVVATPVGYVAPLNEIVSGSTVVFTAAAASHPTADATNASQCFLVVVGVTTEPGPVRFDVADGGLIATSYPDTPEEWVSPCPNARPLPDGRFLLPFQCMLHPWMHGALLVDP